MPIIRPKRKRTMNRALIDAIFIAYFVLLVVVILNRQYWQIALIGTTAQYIAIGLVVVIAAVLIVKIYRQISKGKSK